MRQPLDPRTHAYRDDLAAAYLAGQVDAARFVEGEIYQVQAATAPVHAAADPDLRRVELFQGGFPFDDLRTALALLIGGGLLRLDQLVDRSGD